jgi:hypothetical protein
MRKPIVAGQFYPDDKEKLEKEIKKYVKKEPDPKIKAAIVPHAGYLFSGRCAGKVYSVLPWAETYVILGVNHQGVGEDIAVSLDTFQTPSGETGNDAELGEEILKELQIYESEDSHLYEHSIEVQLPFLQYTQKNFHIVPILLKNYNLEICEKLARVIVECSRRLRRRIVVIASSDFTHTGPLYSSQADISIDREAIEKIKNLNSQELLETAEKTTICGAGAIAATIEAAKLLEAKEAELLEYYDSSSVLNNENKVGYAGIVFR